MAKIIVVTGASTGIGAQTARLLAEGNQIFIHYNASREAAEQTATEVQERGGTAHLVQADLFTEAGCDALYSEVSVMTNRIDVLVNNAGGLVQRQGVSEFEWGMMERVFALNTFSTMLLTSLFVPLLEKGTDPCIVNISSVAARTGAPTATIYGAAKGAVDSFTRGAAAELAPEIRVNAVAPGVIETPFHERYSTPERMEQFREKTPLKHHGRAADVARAILFLIENSFITGETIDVNGGLFMR
ncbi:MAG: SDR family oxidoreductase [Spirochaetaceae bacterium]|nr:MAG: SDR family oxidoreductase [Spirochaetaceae bacterium]